MHSTATRKLPAISIAVLAGMLFSLSAAAGKAPKTAAAPPLKRPTPRPAVPARQSRCQ